MSSVLILKPQEVVRILKNLGFVEVRQKGSHKQFRHEDARGTTVPFQKGVIYHQGCYGRLRVILV